MSRDVSVMEKIFNPRSIVFVGASANMGKWGGLVFHNLVKGGYGGSIYPVNTHGDSILGYDVYRSIDDIPADVDLAIFTIPARVLPDAVSQCVSKRVGAGIVITAGFSELGEQGRKLQDEVTNRARAGGMVLVGPNCQGVAAPANNLFCWLPPFKPEAGQIGIASQSGGFSIDMSEMLADFGFGSSKVISVGNCADLSWPDYLDYFRHDPETKVVLLYIEGIEDGKEFFRAAKELALEKPVVIVKGGKTGAGTKAANSHTGALAGSNAIFEAACKQAGLTPADSAEDAVILAAAFINTPLPRGKRVCILTGGGGLGVMTADAVESKGLDLVPLSDSTIEKLKEHLPPWWAPNNPVDMVAGFGYSGPKEIIPILMENDEFDGIIYHGIGWAYSMLDPVKESHGITAISEEMRQQNSNQTVKSNQYLLEYMAKWGKPLLVTSGVANLAVRRNYEGILMFLDEGIMIYPTIQNIVNAFAALAERHRFLSR